MECNIPAAICAKVVSAAASLHQSILFEALDLVCFQNKQQTQAKLSFKVSHYL